MNERQGPKLPPYVMLMLVSIVMSFAIAGVYSLTKDTIEEAAAAAQAAARSSVMENAAEMTELSPEEGAPVDYCYEALDEAGNVVGYVSQITVVGFGGEIEVTVGLDTRETITGVSVGGKDFSETSGLGAKTREPEFTEQFRGMSGMLILKQNIDSVTGASISSGAVVSGVNKAVEYMKTLLPEDPNAQAEEIPLSGEQLQELLPGAESVRWMGGGAGIDGWWQAEEGYVVRATGFGEGPIAVTMGFDNDRTVTGIIIGDEYFMETEGRGDGVLADWYKQQFIGRSGVQAYGEGIDAITGATVTSDATLAAINACMSFDPADPGTAAPADDGITADASTEASVPEENAVEPDPNPPTADAVTEASLPEEETAPEPDAMVVLPVEEEEEVYSEPGIVGVVLEPEPDAVTEASVPEEETAATPSPLGEPIVPAPLNPGQALPTPALTPASAPAADAVTEASVSEEEPAVTPPPLGEPIGAAGTEPDAVTEASVTE